MTLEVKTAEQMDGSGAVHKKAIEWGNTNEQELLRRFRQIDKKTVKPYLQL